MKKPFVILDDGHGVNTPGKRSPLFEELTRINGRLFCPGDFFKENEFKKMKQHILKLGQRSYKDAQYSNLDVEKLKKLKKKARRKLCRPAELFLKNKPVRKLPPTDVRPVFTVPQQDKRIKGFNTVRALVVLKDPVRRPADAKVKIFDLHLNDEGGPSPDRIQSLLKSRDPLTAVQKPELSQFFQGIITNASLLPAHPLKSEVVKNHRDAVLRHLNVELDPVPLICRLPDRRQRILRQQSTVLMKPSVGKEPRFLKGF